MSRVGSTDMALVFRCETDAKGVAAAIHANCLRLANEIKDRVGTAETFLVVTHSVDIYPTLTDGQGKAKALFHSRFDRSSITKPFH